MSTPRDLVTAAVATSLKNRPTTANQENELRMVVFRALRQYVADGAAINPDYYAAYLAVAPDTLTFATGWWKRPADAEVVYGIAIQGGAPVVVVDPLVQDVNDFAAVAAVRRWQGGVVSLGGVAGPTPTSTLVFTYARQPAMPATLDTPLDAEWPTAYDPLLIAEVAIYLARKDGRADELPALIAERDAWHALYRQFLLRETMGEQHIFHPLRFTDPVRLPLTAGGTP